MILISSFRYIILKIVHVEYKRNVYISKIKVKSRPFPKS